MGAVECTAAETQWSHHGGGAQYIDGCLGDRPAGSHCAFHLGSSRECLARSGEWGRRSYQLRSVHAGADAERGRTNLEGTFIPAERKTAGGELCTVRRCGQSSGSDFQSSHAKPEGAHERYGPIVKTGKTTVPDSIL